METIPPHKKLVSMPDIFDESKKLMEAEICLETTTLEAAKAILFVVMKSNRETLKTLNLLGKVYMKMRNF